MTSAFALFYCPVRNSHAGAVRQAATLNQIRAVMGIPSESRSQRLGINLSAEELAWLLTGVIAVLVFGFVGVTTMYWLRR
jgi:hypothetical protein